MIRHGMVFPNVPRSPLWAMTPHILSTLIKANVALIGCSPHCQGRWIEHDATQFQQTRRLPSKIAPAPRPAVY